VDPTFQQLENADIDIMVGATYENIMMVEGEMKEVSEKEMLDAIKFAHEEIKKQCVAQKELTEAVGKSVKRTYCQETNDDAVKEACEKFCYDRCYTIAKTMPGKLERQDALDALKEEFMETFPEEERDDEKTIMVNRYFAAIEKRAMRNMILNEGVRLDGRTPTQVRPIWCEAGYLPGAHGSAIFTRGETQALATVTLGTKLDMKETDDVLQQDTQQFVLHYNFPPFCTGEAKAQRGLSRREIGHGNLAWRALKPVVPIGDENPYAVRVVSDILESNGSSSMATVCAGTLALMDSGLKIKKPVAGIAMGFIDDPENKRHVVLTDILGDEDHLGDMDFKVAGTKDGITATQMDIKVDGMPYEVLEAALQQAKEGREHIMGEMMKCISEPRADFRPNVPRIIQIRIPGDFIGAVIGTGGKVIQEIQKTTGTTITITEEGEEGVVDIFGENKDAMDAALARIKEITAVPEIGKVYHGKVVSVLEFGAFVEILPGKEGLLHISELQWGKTDRVEDILKEGDEVDVKLLEIDEKTGKMRLSRRALLPKPEGYVEPEIRPRSPRSGDRRDSRGGDRRDFHRGDRDFRGGERGYRNDRRGDRDFHSNDRGGYRNDRRDNRNEHSNNPQRGNSSPYEETYSQNNSSDEEL
jgi:polyribonucleotide nucleotidyltransferase